MSKDLRHISRQLPVLIDHDQTNVMARADIFQKPDSVLIQIVAKGEDGQLLAEFLGQVEALGVSFSYRPVARQKKRERISDAEETVS